MNWLLWQAALQNDTGTVALTDAIASGVPSEIAAILVKFALFCGQLLILGVVGKKAGVWKRVGDAVLDPHDGESTSNSRLATQVILGFAFVILDLIAFEQIIGDNATRPATLAIFAGMFGACITAATFTNKHQDNAAAGGGG